MSSDKRPYQNSTGFLILLQRTFEFQVCVLRDMAAWESRVAQKSSYRLRFCKLDSSCTRTNWTLEYCFFVSMAKLNDRCFCCIKAAMCLSEGHQQNSFPNNAGMKNRTDLNLDEVISLSIIYHILESWLILLNGYESYFRCKSPILSSRSNSQAPLTSSRFLTLGKRLGRVSSFIKDLQWHVFAHCFQFELMPRTICFCVG